jgi:hypothetical protein
MIVIASITAVGLTIFAFKLTFWQAVAVSFIIGLIAEGAGGKQ